MYLRYTNETKDPKDAAAQIERAVAAAQSLFAGRKVNLNIELGIYISDDEDSLTTTGSATLVEGTVVGKLVKAPERVETLPEEPPVQEKDPERAVTQDDLIARLHVLNVQHPDKSKAVKELLLKHTPGGKVSELTPDALLAAYAEAGEIIEAL
jgi:hypothetical protein